ncbi:Endoribonuclease L-PSP family protein [Calocera cornea HHB12733]|uniref:Endoribonuclease L-PSP family protein n=1 Tax=Calocera cornea HHB12733 TaxID=1353952 RepID=A0A165CX93_9BASI|nr:Endoribonuclease L-PSP family protein [Calocera cornea HHB12733]
MPEKKVIYAADAIPTLPIFCHATQDPTTGLIYCSGSIGSDDKYQLPEGVQAQTTLLLDNVKKVLAAAGSSLDQVLKVNVYLTNMKRDFGPMNEVYGTYFSKLPARTCVGVAQLPFDALVEMECTAMPN